MSLRDQIVTDVNAILRHTAGFGEPIVLTAPDGTVSNIVGQTNDISSALDPETGLIVAGRRVHVCVPITDLPAGDRPRAVTDTLQKPWRVSFPNIISAASAGYKVTRTMPDDSAGTILLFLTNYIAP